MQQDSINTAKQNDKIVHKFIEGFLDPRRRETKSLKKIHQACLKMIEGRISQTSDLKNLLSLYEHEPWIQKLLVSHVLFRMYHHAAFLGMKEFNPDMRVPYKKRFYLSRRRKHQTMQEF